MASSNGRPWLTRYVWMAATLTFAALAAYLVITGMRRDRGLPKPYLFRLAPLDISGHDLSRQLTLTSAAFLAIAFYVLYLWTTHRAHLARRLDMPTTVGHGIDPGLIRGAAREIQLGPQQTQFFWETLQYPARVFSRISESVETYTRTTKIHANYTINMPPRDAGDVMVPLLLVRTGTIVSGLRVFDADGDRVSSQSQVRSLSHTVAILDALVSSAGRRAQRAYRRGGDSSLESEIVALLCRGYVSDAEMEAEVPEILRLLDRLNELGGRPIRELDMAVDIVASLYGVYPVCIRVERATGVAASETIRCSVERRVLSPVLRRRETPDTLGLFREIPTQVNKAREWYGRRKAAQLGLSLALFGVRDLTTDSIRRVFDFARRVFGIRSSHVVVSLASAALTSSYHLDVKGPEGNYLVRQSIVDSRGLRVDDRDDPQNPYTGWAAAVEPAGQRHANVYLRGAFLSWREHYYRAQFFERPPGSTGLAALSAVSSALIVWVLAVRYSPDELAPNPGDPSGVLQILLAFPLLTSAYAFMSPGQSAIGGVLSARVSAGLVGLLSVLAVGASMVPTLFGSRSLTVIAGSLTVIAAGALGSWMQRTATYQRISRSEVLQ